MKAVKKQLKRKVLIECGCYIAYEGKLAIDDAREAYVTENGTPIASFWNIYEAIRYAKEMNK